MKLVYSGEAVHDLVRLRAFIAQENPIAASRIADELVSRIENLCLFPDMGRPVKQSPTLGVVRDMVFDAYIVRYAVHAETIAILRLWHHYEQRR